AGSGDDDVHQSSASWVAAPLALDDSVPITASVSISIATWVGHTVWRPCCLYQSARYGSSTLTTTFGTWNCLRAIWATTMLVLSPSVEQTTTSARSMPASRSASTSRAGPTVNDPPLSSQLVVSWPRSSSVWASGLSSRTLISWPSLCM